MPDTLKLTPHETVTILRSEPAVLEVEAVYGPADDPPPPHLHPAQDEHFEVLEGELRVRLGGDERTLSAGDMLDIPRWTKHQMWNASAVEARVRWQTKPAGRTEQWFRGIDRLVKKADGMPGPLMYGVLLTEYRDVFRLAAGPDWLLRPALAVLGAIGRLRGYGPEARAGRRRLRLATIVTRSQPWRRSKRSARTRSNPRPPFRPYHAVESRLRRMRDGQGTSLARTEAANL
jgi:quercetin dioxygenase-like cupin family protein